MLVMDWDEKGQQDEAIEPAPRLEIHN